MPVKKPILYKLTILTTPAVCAVMADALEDTGALSISILAKPRAPSATVEALYDKQPKPTKITAQISIIATMHQIKIPKITIQKMPPTDWVKKVAGDFPPIKITRWTVFGSHHAHKIKSPRHALQIDATSAFGTGEHPTTRGCLMMLDKFLKQKNFAPKTMLDVGCGTGILAMAYANATDGMAVAIDMDAQSVGIAKVNAKINKLDKQVKFYRGMGYAPPAVKKHAPYDLIMANIFAGPLCDLAGDLKKHLSKNGIAILSGILTSQARDVIKAHTAKNLRLIQHTKLGEWSVLAFRHKNAIIKS